MDQERLIAAAIRFYDETTKKLIIMTGVRHAEIFRDMYKLHINYDKRTTAQGFLTNFGEFVNREDAKLIAIEANQLITPIEKLSYELFSEDVW